MNEIKITVILFDGLLSEREIPSFRGAVMAIAGNDPLFHNHTEDAKDINRYPRIQYKLIDGHPAVVGIMEGADAVKRLFIPGAKHVMRIGQEYREFVVQDVVRRFFKPSLKEGDDNSTLNVPSGAFSNVPFVTDSNVPLQKWLL